MATFILNLHGVGIATRAYEPGEQLYWLSRDELRRVLDLVQVASMSHDVALTVDDGNASDYEIIAPELQRRGLSATFFVLAGKLSRPGYLRSSEIRSLAADGFGIGSHGLQHVDWARCDDVLLDDEVVSSKAILEAITGYPVTQAAAPFGSYDRRVLRALAKCGYRDVFCSDGGPRLTGGWPTPRQTLRGGLDIAALAGRIRGHALHHRARSELRILAKSWLPGSALHPFRAIGRSPRSPRESPSVP
jgi:peptidoglycan/xylan/chitin deacetylase (PgdA/CDA1 family)